MRNDRLREAPASRDSKKPERGRGDTESLSQRVYDYVLNQLLSDEGGLVPGQIINRKEIAETLGVSVAPVLEAFVQLSSEGFLETVPRKGTVVRAVTNEDVLGMLLVREALECEAARIYSGEPIVKHSRELLDHAARIDRLEPPSIERSREDFEFHSRLVGLVGSAVLITEYRRVMRYGVFQAMHRLFPNSDIGQAQSHVELIRRLGKANPDKAEKIIREHMRSDKRFLFRDFP